MKFKWFAAILVVLTGFAMVGCGPRWDVAQDKVMAAIDRWFGELDVKRKQIDHALVAGQEALDVVTHEKIRVQVQLELLEKRAANLAVRQGQIDEQLQPLKKKLANGSANEATTSAGGDLRYDAQRLIQERRLIVAQAEGMKSARSALAKAAQTLVERQQVLEPCLDQYRMRLEEIDVKLACMKTLQATSTAVASSGPTLNARWSELETQLNELSVAVESDLRFEDEKWSRLKRLSPAGSTSPTVDALVTEIEDLQQAEQP